MVLIQIRTLILSVLILVETVCKGYQQTPKVAASKEGVNKELKMMLVGDKLLELFIY